MNKTNMMLSLQAHFPVIHKDDFHLEQQFFERLSNIYLPILSHIRNHLLKEPITMAFSPSFLEVLSNVRLMKRYYTYLQKKQALIENQWVQSQQIKEKAIFFFYRTKIKKLMEFFLECEGEFILILKDYINTGRIVAVSSSGAYFPFIQSKEGLQLHVELSVNAFEKHLGFSPKGFWSPYGVYSITLDKLLSDKGIEYAYISEQIISGQSREVKDPVVSPHGLLLIPHATNLIDLVIGEKGYQTGDNYLDPFSDIAYERKWDELKNFTIWEDFRAPTGLKLRQKGKGSRTATWYDVETARECLDKHANHFMEQLEIVRNEEVLSINLSLYQLGNDWLEAPYFLQLIMNKVITRNSFEWITPEHLITKKSSFSSLSSFSQKGWWSTINPKAYFSEKSQEMFRELVKMEQSLKIEVNGGKSECAKHWLMANDYALLKSSNQDVVKRFYVYKDSFYSDLKQPIMENNLTIFNFPINPDVFYSTNKTHNHLIREEKKTGKQRILMLSWEYPPSVMGGLGKHVRELSKALSMEGYDVSVLTPSFIGAPSYERIDNTYVYRVKEFYQTNDDFHHYVARFNLNMVELAIELHRQRSFDIVHAHDWMVGLAARSIKEALSLPLITTIHALEIGRIQGNQMSQMQQKTYHQEKQLMMESDIIIVCSSYMEEVLHREYAFRKEKVHVIPNGVGEIPYERANESIQRLLNKYDYNHLVLSLGRIVLEKGFDTFIQAAVIILESYPKCLFIIGGKGPLLVKFREQVANLGLENSIMFIGFLHEHEKAYLLHQCDMLVVPSHYEPFGIVALEGMIAAKPVIVSKTGGLASIVEEEHSGLLFESGVTKQLVSKIERLIENPEVGKRLGKNAKKIVKQKYSWEDVRRKTVAIYDMTITTSSVQ
ncbi:glycosyltransferase [Sutcliffiella halmapala]|uniref:glycosyltransferase n=1 Tax=Sutcliffiella halmapala TaxID=79882 RepID=UPI00147291FB|nr:glycosyltransferase [Sutcliffiella halmapala]